MKLLITAAAVLAVVFLAVWFRRRIQNRQAATGKVVQLKARRKVSGQAGVNRCSFCKKKAKRLSFYANEGGRVIGVCDICKPQAERRALLRL
ncbi:hypothetical protein [Paenibacillus sp. y28]|uniref:hypothetical protein n=1 Tax=Paenibacillus sp. y28 TaxID=3129110 RepID=UPI003017169D